MRMYAGSSTRLSAKPAPRDLLGQAVRVHLPRSALLLAPPATTPYLEVGVASTATQHGPAGLVPLSQRRTTWETSVSFSVPAAAAAETKPDGSWAGSRRVRTRRRPLRARSARPLSLMNASGCSSPDTISPSA
ncbi:hypothetical protein BS78_09G026400 [Paspalum vaginatum]|nr:hypothetical protein BS78_09G026400 [Paspalum vaginatum]